MSFSCNSSASTVVRKLEMDTRQSECIALPNVNEVVNMDEGMDMVGVMYVDHDEINIHDQSDMDGDHHVESDMDGGHHVGEDALVNVDEDVIVNNEGDINDEVNVNDEIIVNEEIDVNAETELCGDETKLTPNVDLKHVPHIGMEFDSEREASNFYKFYAELGGFDTCIRDSRRKNGDLYYKMLVCNKQGFKKRKGDETREHAVTRCGCKASMAIERISKTTKWRVRNIEYAHNHYLHSPSKILLHKTSKRMCTPEKGVVDALSQSGVRPGKVMDVFAHEARGMEHVSFSHQQSYKYIQRVQNSCYGKDAQTMIDYFIKKKDENSEFYYTIQINEMQQVRNCFWVDATSREDYYYFGDVVSFDTTYKKNKYLMPFAQFTGVNHHGSSIIFGCGLLVDETKESFIWLFKQWLHCMGGKAPKAILTDDDLAMRAAIKEVFPNTMHRCCNWHIFTKVPTYIGNLYKYNDQFKRMWHMWFFKSETIEEFESGWEKMVKAYPQLEKIDWATNLWKDRHTWAKPYFMDTFMAGMSTTQRSENINRYFKSWFNSQTTLSGFVKKYEDAIVRQRHIEEDLDFKMNNAVEPTTTQLALELHLRDTFTPSIFRKYFKEQFVACLSCSPILLKEHLDGLREYKITQEICDGGIKEYLISFNPITQHLSSCRCKLWEFRGVVCSHMLTIMKTERIKKLPTYYILKRWTRNAKKYVGNNHSTASTLPHDKLSFIVKKNILQKEANMCVNEGLSSEACYNHMKTMFAKALADAREIKSKEMNAIECSVNASTGNIHISSVAEANVEAKLSDPHPDHAKGTTKRCLMGIEHSKIQRLCATCPGQGHDSRTCPERINEIDESNIVKQRICHECRGTGHDKRNCRKLRHHT